MTPAFSAAEQAALLGRPIRASLTIVDRLALADRTVVVTGAGGSIGSELVRELAACRPAQLVLVERSELHLFHIEREVRERWPHLAVEPCLTDVTRGRDVSRIFRHVRPDVVYHAAAYKHVTMTERAAWVAAEVNVLGTIEVADAASAAGSRFVLISSDKAAAPQSVMGATKRVAELVSLARASAGFRPIVVRFGNVLASSGSLLEIMRDCIRRGRPVPITDPAATRYFMTVGEAAALVIKADLNAQSPETFWLDMGEPVRIGDLAARVLALEARAGFPEVPLEIIGLRPGEKLEEQLHDDALELARTTDRRILVARHAPLDRAGIAHAESRLRRAVNEADAMATLDAIAGAVTAFTPSPEARAAADRWSPRGSSAEWAGQTPGLVA